VSYKSLKLNAVILSYLIVFLSFSGCSSSKKLTSIEISQDYRKAIKNISVSEDIKFACDDFAVYPFRYAIWGCCIAGPCGLFPGALIDMTRGYKYKKELKKVANLEEILKSSLHKEFVSVLKEDKHLQYVEKDNEELKPDAEFVFVIQEYGLISDSSTKALTPNMEIDVYLIYNPPYQIRMNSDDKLESKDPDRNPIIFSKHYEWKSSNRVPAYKIEEYLKKPQLLGEVYTKACELIAKRILNDL
jgi:hypothetical protein